MLIVYGVAIAGAIFSLWWAITAKPSPARANLMAGMDVPEAPPKDSPLSGVGRLVRRYMPQGYLRNLDDIMVQAGHPWKLDMARMLAVKVVLSAIFFLLWTILGYALVGIGFAALLFFLPDYAVLSQRDKRQAAIQEAAADTIDQLTICVEAGLGFDAALLRVANNNEGPLAVELQRTVEDVQAGMPREQALRSLGVRTRLPEIKQLVSALIQAQRHGVTIADTLRIQSADLRDKRKQRIEEKAAKLPIKMLFPIIVCFMPVFFIIIMVPSLAGISKAFG